MSIHPLVAAFLVVWVGVVSRGLFQRGALVPGAMIFFAVLLTLGGFYPEAFKAERAIRQALRADAQLTNG